MIFPFASLSPDLEPLNNPGALKAVNCIPQARSYGPLRGPKGYGAPLPALALNAISFLDSVSGDTFTIAGTADKLYRLVSGAWTVLASGFTADQRNGWAFQKFGRRLICAPGNHVLIAVDLDTGAVSNLAGSPQATSLAVVGGYLFAGLGETLYNSGLNDPTDWNTAGSGGADVQPIPTGGSITGLTGGEIGFCFSENAVRRISPGADINYSLSEVETDQGCIVPGSLVKFRAEAFYLARNGFYRFNGASVPIGEDQIDKSFWRDVDEGSLDAMRAAIDPINKLVIWSYPSRDAPHSGVCDKLLFYHYTKGRWSTGQIETTLVMSSVTEGLSLDGASGEMLIDDSDELTDGRVFLGGAPILSIADRLNQFSTLTGDVLAATLQTGEVDLSVKGQAVHVQDVRPIVDGSNAKLTMQAREWLSDEPTTYQSTVHAAAPAVANFDRVRCRYARWQLDIPAGEDWRFAMGVELDGIAPGGGR